MKRRALFITLVILGLLIPYPSLAQGPPQTQTIDIANTLDDGFITEVGNGIDAHLWHVLDPNMNLRAFLFFRELDINFWEPLTNATLRIRSSGVLPFDNESLFFVYAVVPSGPGGSLPSAPGNIITAPLTTAYTAVNSSTWYGNQWHEIDVTAQVREVMTRTNWQGDGLAGTETGDDMGFILRSSENQPTRYFYDYLGNPTYSADLVLHWNHEPPPPSGDPDFNQTYRGLDIWEIPGRNYSSYDLDWSVLPDFTTLTETDSGADITIYNSSYLTVGSMLGTSTGALFNDTGVLNINSAIMRGRFNITSVGGGGGSIHSVFGVAELSGQDAHFYGTGLNGEGVYLVIRGDADNVRFRYSLCEKFAGNQVYHLWSPFFNDTELNDHWIEFGFTSSWCYYSIYNNSAMSSDYLVTSDINAITSATFPFAVPIITASAYGAGINGFLSYQLWRLNETFSADTTYIVTYPNGTEVSDDCITIECAQAVIDDLLDGADPEDPDPPGEDYPQTGPFTRFRTRLYILVLGVGCFVGPVIVFAMKKNRLTGGLISGGLITMLIGLGLMLAIRQI